jgi:hypothetical protein
MRGGPSSRDLDAPELSAPTGQPRGSLGRRSTPNDDRDDNAASVDAAPLLAMPNVSAPPIDDSDPAANPPTGQPAASSGNVPAYSSNGTSAPPPRRSIIGNLLSNLGVNWTRR